MTRQEACVKCQALIHVPVSAAVIDKGIATAGLMAHVVASKYIDHQPLFRLEAIMVRSGVSVLRSTQAEWEGAIGVQLAPLVSPCVRTFGAGMYCMPTRRWWRCSSPALARRTVLTCGVTAPGSWTTSTRSSSTSPRAGHNARLFLGIGEDGMGGWRGTFICDDYAGYKQAMNAGVTEAGCLAHARRKFHKLWANRSSTLAEQALKLFGVIYDVER